METVRSDDGTTIAFDRTGEGPALVLVMGAFCDRHSTRSLTKLLAPEFTVYEYDRRGRGASGDTAPYAVTREVEDLVAVVDAAGGAPFVFGHSSGAILALETAASGVPMMKLAAYEPPFIVDETREHPGADLGERLEALVFAGDRGDAAKLFLSEAVQVPPEVLPMIEAGPGWPGMTAIAHTLSYDVAVSNGNELPANRLANLHVPTLVLGGGNSPEWFQNSVRTVAATIPGAQHRYLEGQDHGAADEALAPVLIDFFTAR
jgi:pimeloyl-ACP methyl ester carboxylesterase